MKKIIGLIILAALFLSFSDTQAGDRKEKRAKARLEMAQLIESGKYRFVARSANSVLGNFNNLSYNYDLEIDSLQVKAYLPYYGRAYSVSYGSEGGVKFNLKADKIEKVWNEKRKLYTISTELTDFEDTYSIFLKTSLDGFADLRINFRDRTWISYSGIIEKLESKE